MMEKRCELCGDRATLYCSADDANVCWSCDAKVHSANFLVARHARSVLCSNCCRETECKTSGANPSPLSRLCSGCNPSTVERIVENDCNGDSEEKESSETHSYPSATTEVQESGCTCASQESHTGSRARALERRKAAVEMLGRPRATSRGFHGADSKRLLSGLERGKKVQGRRSKRRSSSPTGVIDILALKLANHNHRAAEGGQQPADGGSRVGSNSPTGCVHTTSNLPLPVEEAADDSSCLSMVYNESCEL